MSTRSGIYASTANRRQRVWRLRRRRLRRMARAPMGAFLAWSPVAVLAVFVLERGL